MSPFALLLLYQAFQTTIPLQILYTATLTTPDAAATAHATLHLLATIALLPALYAAAPLPHPPRLPLLSAFLSALVTLISSSLRVLALPRALPPALPPLHLATRLSLSAAAFLFIRRAPALQEVRKALPPSLRNLVARPRSRKRLQTSPGVQPDVAPALLAFFLHSISDLSARSVEAVCRIADVDSSTAAAADAAAAALAAAAAMPVLSLALRVLVQAAPNRVATLVHKRCQTLQNMEGVVRCVGLRFWEERVGIFVGTVCVFVKQGVEARGVIDAAHRAFDGVLHDVTVQVESLRQEEADVALT